MHPVDVKLPVYMDHHATTPVAPQVLARMLPYFSENFGNAASRNHSFGWQAEETVDVCRTDIGRLVGASGREMIFTSGATESNNLAILGVGEAHRDKRHLITQATEHKAVLDPMTALTRRGCTLTVLPVDAAGMLDPDSVARAITDDTLLVSVMAANNEVGTLQPVSEIGAICKARGVFFHVDAAQVAGLLPLNVDALGIDLLSFSAHKFYGPKGIGALYVRRKNPRVEIAPMLHGGGHERGLRSGTLNVPGIVGMAEACKLAAALGRDDAARIGALRDRLQRQILDAFPDTQLNGHPTRRHPGNLNVSFPSLEAERLIMRLRDVAVSSGAACASATLEPSHVLRALGVPAELAHGSIRFGLGRNTTEGEVDYVAGRVIEEVRALHA